MSEYTLDFLEAVRILNEGKCKKIESKFGVQFTLNMGQVELCSSYSNHALGVQTILNKFRLVGVKPEKKKVVLENVKWKVSDYSIIYPVRSNILDNFNWNELLCKPEMKMTLEWEE